MRGDGRELNNFILCILDLENHSMCMKDITMLNKPPLDFFGCNFCLVEKHRMAFVLISKCGLTFLENIAIYASAGMIPDTEDQTHFYIARVKPERFLVPVSEMSGYEREQ